MKIRVKIPEEYCIELNGVNSLHYEEKRQQFVDDIIMWGMEIEMDIAFYAYYRPKDWHWGDRNLWAVFTVEPDYLYMFSLKWGAVLHKKSKEVA